MLAAAIFLNGRLILDKFKYNIFEIRIPGNVYIKPNIK